MILIIIILIVLWQLRRSARHDGTKDKAICLNNHEMGDMNRCYLINIKVRLYCDSIVSGEWFLVYVLIVS